jgi:hypothetical protein
MVNDMMDLLSDVPATLAAAWAVWLGAGLLLAMWYRKAKAEADFAVPQAMAARTVARAKSGPRPVAEARPMAEPRPLAEPRPIAPARPKPAPISVGDPFGDLATLLDQPAESAPPPAPAYRVPSESPILNSAGSPVLRKNDPDPGY